MIGFHKRAFSQIMSAWVLGRARVNIFQLISTCIWSLKPNLDVLEENWKRNSHRCQFRHHNSSHLNWHWVGELVFVDLIQNTWNLFFIWHHFHQQLDDSWPHGWTRPWWTERCLHHSQLPILIIPAWPPGWDLLLMMMIHLLDSVGSIGNVCRWDSQPSCKTCPLTSRFFHLDFPSLKFSI